MLPFIGEEGPKWLRHPLRRLLRMLARKKGRKMVVIVELHACGNGAVWGRSRWGGRKWSESSGWARVGSGREEKVKAGWVGLGIKKEMGRRRVEKWVGRMGFGPKGKHDF